MRQEAQRSLGGDAGIFLAQRSGRRVARSCEQIAACQLLRGIEVRESLLLHVNLAAHLEDIGMPLARELLRNVGDMGDVRHHVLTHLPITARRGPHKLPALVTQRAGEAVDFILGSKSQGGVFVQRKKPSHPRHELGDLFIGECVVEAHHAHCMLHL